MDRIFHYLVNRGFTPNAARVVITIGGFAIVFALANLCSTASNPPDVPGGQESTGGGRVLATKAGLGVSREDIQTLFDNEVVFEPPKKLPDGRIVVEGISPTGYETIMLTGPADNLSSVVLGAAPQYVNEQDLGMQNVNSVF